MDADRLINLGFWPKPPAPKTEYRLSVRVLGFVDGDISASPDVGLVCSPGLDAVDVISVSYARTCTAVIPNTTPPAQVTLTATPTAAGTQFGGWGGNCSGTGTCTVTMDRDQGVTASFLRPSAASSGTFTATDSLSTPRKETSAVLLANGMVLVAGGLSTLPGYLDPAATFLATAELYDPALGQFITTGSMVTEREHPTATLLPNGTVLIAGGSSHAVYLASAEIYDPATGTFSPTGNMMAPRRSHTATLLSNGKVLMAGGSPTMASAEVYDPASGTFSPTGSMTVGRSYHTATLLADGTVLITGVSADAAASAEIYNPASGTFSRAGSMSVGRLVHSAVALADGRVLVVGGIDQNGSVIGSAEIYDPATGVFSQTGAMTVPREGTRLATLLPSGMVLVAGGYGTSSWLLADSTLLASAELYNPADGTFTPTGSMSTARVTVGAFLLRNGKVLLAAGTGPGLVPVQTAELYNP